MRNAWSWRNDVIHLYENDCSVGKKTNKKELITDSFDTVLRDESKACPSATAEHARVKRVKDESDVYENSDSAVKTQRSQ